MTKVNIRRLRTHVFNILLETYLNLVFITDADDGSLREGGDAIVTGWGATVEKGLSSNIPMKVSNGSVTPGSGVQKFTSDCERIRLELIVAACKC